MALILSQEQRMIQETVNRIATNILSKGAAAADRNRTFPSEGIGALADAGLMGMAVPPPYGGQGMDTLSYVLATEAVSRACASTGLIFVTHAVACLSMTIGASDELKRQCLPAMAAGARLGTVAVSEPGSGANPAAVSTAARAADGEYVINGTKWFITSAQEAHYNLVLVVTDKSKGPGGLSFIMVEKGTPGLRFGSVDDRMGLRGVSSREMVFEDCRVPRRNLLGAEGKGIMLLQASGVLGLLGMAGIALGLSQAALDASVNHAKQRLVNGSPIANHQAVQFAIAEMSAAVEAARSLTYLAAVHRDNSPPGPPLMALKAKLVATEMALQVTDRALQVHGGQGYTCEHPIERHYRDARGLTLHFQTSETLRETLGKLLLGLQP